jgi:hypothetical protein
MTIVTEKFKDSQVDTLREGGSTDRECTALWDFFGRKGTKWYISG